MKSLRILFLTPNTTDSCSFYRSGGIAPDLARKMNVDIRVTSWDKIVLHWQAILDFDLIMMQRPFASDAVNLARYMKEMRVPLWIDYDDNLLVVPAENPQVALYGPETRENIKQLLKFADIVTVTNDVLKASYLEYNNNIHVVPNAFNDYIFKDLEIKPARAKMIGWRGGPSHIFDVMTKAVPINKATQDFDEWQFLFLGHNPWHLAERNNQFYMPPMDVILYFQNVRKMAPALIHVPLHDNLFNQCKSNIAWIEATYFGAVCLGPAWRSWEVPGCMHYGNDDEYYDGIKAICNNEVDINVQNRISWAYIQEELMLSKVNVKRMEVINRIV